MNAGGQTPSIYPAASGRRRMSSPHQTLVGFCRFGRASKTPDDLCVCEALVLVQGQVYLLINTDRLLPWCCSGIQMAEFRCNPLLTCISTNSNEKPPHSTPIGAQRERSWDV